MDIERLDRYAACLISLDGSALESKEEFMQNEAKLTHFERSWLKETVDKHCRHITKVPIKEMDKLTYFHFR